jgi:hypothetical protein
VIESPRVGYPSMEFISDIIYLDKHGDDGDHLPDTWEYFRVTGLPGMGNPEGTFGATIEVCRVSWPKLEDIPPATETPGVVALASAWELVNKALRQWGIERERSIFIGIRDRQVSA